MALKQFRNHIKTLDTKQLKQEREENKTQLQKERKRAKVNRDHLRILSLETREEEYKFELIQRRNREYINEEQKRRKKHLR